MKGVKSERWVGGGDGNQKKLIYSTKPSQNYLFSYSSVNKYIIQGQTSVYHASVLGLTCSTNPLHRIS